jgi:hypothetical protein
MSALSETGSPGLGETAAKMRSPKSGWDNAKHAASSGNGESRAPGGKKRERLKRKIGELHRDLVAGLEPDLDEEGGKRIDRGVGLAIAVAARAPELERRVFGGVRQSKPLGPLPGAAPEQPFVVSGGSGL